MPADYLRLRTVKNSRTGFVSKRKLPGKTDLKCDIIGGTPQDLTGFRWLLDCLDAKIGIELTRIPHYNGLIEPDLQILFTGD